MPEEITDNSPFPYGKYKGVALVNCPAWHLLMQYENLSAAYKKYIDENRELLTKASFNTNKYYAK